jgi:stage III sporulation protein AB
MIRLLGAALVLGGSTAIGLLTAAQLRRRAQVIAALLGMLDRMESELSFRLTPLPLLLSRLSEAAGKPLAAALQLCRDRLRETERQPFAEIWREALARNAALPLGEEERKSLEELGRMLGRYELEGQLLAIRSARASLERCLSRAEGERDRLGRLFGVLGVSAGAVLVLLLL